MMTRSRISRAVIAGSLVLGACGGGENGGDAAPDPTPTTAPATTPTPETSTSVTTPATDSPATTAPPTTAPPSTAAVTTAPASTMPPLGPPTTIQVAMSDFAYGGIGGAVPVGTEIAVVNISDSELHEFVAFPLAANEERTVEQIKADGVFSALRGVRPSMVLLAPPDSAEMVVSVGDAVFDRPGRYLILCAVPIGGDPAEYLRQAEAGQNPPRVEGGDPHYTEGMLMIVDVVEG